MKKLIFTVAMAFTLIFSACNVDSKKDKDVEDTTQTIVTENNKIIKHTYTDEDGNKLYADFDNAKGEMKISYNGEESVLKQKRAASGMWYTNDEYEFRGKGNDVVLKKDGVTIFERQDDKVMIEAKNDKGDQLNLTFNNTEGTVKAYLNGGEEINLKEKRAASGIWYNNDNYELRGKGDHYELKKDGEVIFKN